MSDIWYLTKSRIISLIISCIYIAAALFSGEPKSSVVVFGFCLFVLAFIWFGNEVGNIKGYFSGHWIDQPSPGVFVSFLGWIILLIPMFIFIYHAIVELTKGNI
jgi:hypothetical protein